MHGGFKHIHAVLVIETFWMLETHKALWLHEAILEPKLAYPAVVRDEYWTLFRLSYWEASTCWRGGKNGWTTRDLDMETSGFRVALNPKSVLVCESVDPDEERTWPVAFTGWQPSHLWATGGPKNCSVSRILCLSGMCTCKLRQIKVFSSFSRLAMIHPNTHFWDFNCRQLFPVAYCSRSKQLERRTKKISIAGFTTKIIKTSRCTIINHLFKTNHIFQKSKRY